jgi:hypothetical protein
MPMPSKFVLATFTGGNHRMIRKRLTYANVAATLALLFAMTGGAYAAGKYLISSTRQISPKVLKQLKGNNGLNGANGANGVNGNPGAPGTPGAAGAPGEKGAVGGNGKDGVSVTSSTLKEGDKTCPAGGSEFTAASGKTVACNGSPWAVGGTLPKGATETGQWGWNTIDYKQSQRASVPISFEVPLKAAPTPHFIPKGGPVPEPECKGTFEKPEAETGNLCVFAGVMTESSPPFDGVKMEGFTNAQGAGEAGQTGTIMTFQDAGGEGFAIARGTWAVTG